MLMIQLIVTKESDVIQLIAVAANCILVYDKLSSMFLIDVWIFQTFFGNEGRIFSLAGIQMTWLSHPVVIGWRWITVKLQLSSYKHLNNLIIFWLFAILVIVEKL